MPQARPQAPQLDASLVVVTQRPEQTTWPGAQTHEPLVHDCPVAQARPQAPQLDASLDVT